MVANAAAHSYFMCTKKSVCCVRYKHEEDLTEITGLLLSLHVALGSLAVLSGGGALAMRKGGAHHIASGRVFVLTMGLASLLGAVLGLIKMEGFYITFHAGVLGVTLIASGWLTVRSPTLGRMSMVVGGVNILNTAGLIAAGIHALSLPEGQLFGFHAEDYFFLSGMAGIAALCDLSLLFRKTLPPQHRIARHLWRMCLGFFIAAGSAFTGPGASIFPKAAQKSGLLSAPELIIFLLMLFWLARTLLKRESV